MLMSVITYIVCIVPWISQKAMENNNSSLDVALDNALSITAGGVIVNESEVVVLASIIRNAEELDVRSADSR